MSIKKVSIQQLLYDKAKDSIAVGVSRSGLTKLLPSIDEEDGFQHMDNLDIDFLSEKQKIKLIDYSCRACYIYNKPDIEDITDELLELENLKISNLITLLETTMLDIIELMLQLEPDVAKLGELQLDKGWVE